MGKYLVANSNELYEILEKKYGNRFNGDPLIAMMGRIEGTIDSKKISITFKREEYLLLSTSNTGDELLNELESLLTILMGDVKPICSYDLQRDGDNVFDAMPTIEWDFINPDKRIKEIVNGRAFSDKSKIYNIKLYNGKNISDYVETKKEKENRIKNAKIYGIYPGCIKDVEAVNNLDEANLYLMIDSLGGHIWRCKHDMAHDRIPEFDLTEEEYALEYMVYQTTKFGVELEEPSLDNHIVPTPSYKAWYKFYDNHFKNVLTDIEWNEFQRAQQKGLDTTVFMPKGNWKDTIEEPLLKKLK